MLLHRQSTARSPRLLPGAAALGVAAALALGAAAPAAAQDAEPAPSNAVPAELSVSLSGPDTADAGATGSWEVEVANVGTTPASQVRLSLQLPDGVAVESVDPVDGWACVLGADLSCDLEDEVAGGDAAPAVPVTLSFGPEVSGQQELAAIAEQGLEADQAYRADRGSRAVTVSAAQVPADLAVTLSGPADGTAGGSAAWTVDVTNTGTTPAASGVRLALALPDGVSVASVPAVDGWTCVLGDQLSCQLDDELPAGASAPTLTATLAYAAGASGAKELAAVVAQGEQPDQALRLDRGAAIVTIAPAQAPVDPAPADPASTPPSAPPADAPVQPAAAPVVAAAAAAPVTAPAPRRTPAAGTTSSAAGSTSTGASADDVADPAPLPPAGTPETLPFSDEADEQVLGAPGETGSAEALRTSGPAGSSGGATDVLLMLLGVGALVLLVGGAAVALRLRTPAPATA